MMKTRVLIGEKIKQRLSGVASEWAALVWVTFLISQLYVFMEWVFLVTKPSFLDVFALPDKLRILFISGVLLAGVSLLALGIVYLVGWVVRLKRYPKVFIWLAGLVPSGILASLLLLMLDNFTYTVFSFGIATTAGIGRALYAILFLGLFVWSVWQVAGMTASIHQWISVYARRRIAFSVLSAWLLIGLALTITSQKTGQASLSMDINSDMPTSRPHIVWITADGLSATHLSLYGYERDTTPNLRALAESSLVAENVFSNSKSTMSSLVSMFTGKLPLETRVLYSPDILIGADAYQHLPGILHSNGYYSIQYGYQFYVDAYVVNLKDGFDISNNRSLTSNSIQTELSKNLPEGVGYFVFETGNRIVDRLRHITFLKAMQNPRETLAAQVPRLSDSERLASFFEDLNKYDQPTFVHLHYLGTHGALFEPKKQVFSAGREPTMEGWDRDFFDDAILEFDTSVGRILRRLEQHGLMENTLLIIGSDHAAEFDQRQRIPLLIHFPGGEITGRIQANTQNLDIAPTIVDYLGLPKPVWMNGESLLTGDVSERYIYGTGPRTILGEEMETGEWMIRPERLNPPFYQLGAVSLIDCQRWYELDLMEMSLTSGEAEGHTAPCPEDELPSIEEVYNALLDYLRENGYDVSSLESIPLDRLLIKE